MQAHGWRLRCLRESGSAILPGGSVGALALYLTVTLRNLYYLDRALEKGAPVPSDTRGLWAELFSVVVRLRSKSRHRKKRYRRLLRAVRQSTRALHDGGIILNARNEIQWCNRAAVRLLGLNLATDVGHRIDNLIRNPDFVSHLENPGGNTVSIPSPAVEGGAVVRADHSVRQEPASGDH